MKYKQKYLDNLYKDPRTNFKEIVDVSIYFFDEIENLDYGYEAAHSIERLDAVTRIHLLIQDFSSRNRDHFSCYGYQILWWTLLNSCHHNVYQLIIDNMTPQLKDLFSYWLSHELESDTCTYRNIKRLV